MNGMNNNDANLYESGEPLVKCEITGKMVRAEDIVEFQGKRVSAEGKNILLRTLQEGGSLHGELVRPGFWRRLLCTMLDYCVIWIFTTIFNLIFLGTMVFGYGDMPDAERLESALRISLIIAAASGLISMVYYAVMHTKYGKTLGKMAGGYRVVNMDGTPISGGTACVRAFWFAGVGVVITTLCVILIGTLSFNAINMLGMLGGLYGLANCIALVADGRYNRALHDRLAGTRVVMDAR